MVKQMSCSLGEEPRFSPPLRIPQLTLVGLADERLTLVLAKKGMNMR